MFSAWLRKGIFATGIGTIGSGYLYHRVTEGKKDRHIVLDLDHTLIHAIPHDKLGKDRQFEGMVNSREDFRIDLGYSVRKRRWYDPTIWCLDKVANLHVFTMGTKGYAEQIMGNLDPNKRYFDVVLSRDEKKKDIGDRKYCKDLDLILDKKGLDRGSKDKVLLIDDKRRSFILTDTDNQEPNGIQVKVFDVTMGQDNVLPKVLGHVLYRIARDPNDLTNRSDRRTLIV